LRDYVKLLPDAAMRAETHHFLYFVKDLNVTAGYFMILAAHFSCETI